VAPWRNTPFTGDGKRFIVLEPVVNGSEQQTHIALDIGIASVKWTEAELNQQIVGTGETTAR
jgi:hypothetical protein